MEMQFLTLIKDHNDFMDWVECWGYENCENLDEPKEFPCYASDELVGYEDNEPLFWPRFLYLEEIKEMLDNLET